MVPGPRRQMSPHWEEVASLDKQTSKAKKTQIINELACEHEKVINNVEFLVNIRLRNSFIEPIK